MWQCKKCFEWYVPTMPRPTVHNCHSASGTGHDVTYQERKESHS